MIANEMTLDIREQMAQKLTAIGHCMTFNNDHSPHRYICQE